MRRDVDCQPARKPLTGTCIVICLVNVVFIFNILMKPHLPAFVNAV